MNKSYIFIGLSSFALTIVLFIQINWMLETAKIKEDIFNEKATIVLSRTTEALALDRETCKRIGDCIDATTNSDAITSLGKSEVHIIDSLFNYYMNYYNFEIDYSFVVAKPQFNSNNFNKLENFVYNKSIEDPLDLENVELKLIFPDKKQFLLAEMGPLFITSIILILVVLVLFWRTVLFLIKEKKIAENTRDFLNNMTHEFKTPLTNINLAARMINKFPNTENKIEKYTNIILTENGKLSRQVEEILGMAALERGETPLIKIPINFHQIIDAVIGSFDLQLEKSNGKIIYNPDAKHSNIKGDKIHLTNAFSNLIHNAIQYSNKPPIVTITTANINKSLVISIQDNGIGIEKKYQQKVFEKFFRIPKGNVHEVKGFGLGLAYFQEIISLHNGSIQLKSIKHKGSTFIITLPHE